MLKTQTSFKKFSIHLVRSLCIDEREAFRHWCVGIIPESKLDIKVADDGNMFRLIEFLCNDCKLSFSDVSLLREFLTSMDRNDLLVELGRIELLNSIGCILEGYVKGSGQGTCKNLSFANIVGFLLKIREGNQELIATLLEQFRQLCDEDGKALEILDEVIVSSQLSWSVVISSLVIMGDVYASFTPDDFAENGYYVYMFSETRASEFLTRWIHENGGLKALDELIGKKQEVARSCSALSTMEESLRKNINQLGNIIDMELINR